MVLMDADGWLAGVDGAGGQWRPRRLLVVMPNWVGDAVMATPAARQLRELLPGAFIGGLVRPGIEEVLAGSALFDELHSLRSSGVMGPKRVASKLRPRRYDTALLLTNSFSTALLARIAGIPRRVGYDRDGRGFLLTDRLRPLRRGEVPPFNRSATDPGAWAPVPACEYYGRLASHLLVRAGLRPGALGPLELSVTESQRLDAMDLLVRGGVSESEMASRRLLLLNPGGNDPAKRWPAERFAALAEHLWSRYGLRPLVSGSPGEASLVTALCELIDRDAGPVNLPSLGVTLGALKGVVGTSCLMVTNDTGPRHIAAALGVPVVTLFGPTDRRWTTIPFEDEEEIDADPTLPEEEVSNDHAERCRVDRIGVDRVAEACDRLLRARVWAV